MKKIIKLLLILFPTISFSQNVKFTEYDLENGMHVILHQDNTVPIAVTSVMYHVGAKDENPDRTGFAHFFEHLLFEGSKNIPRGQMDKIIDAAVSGKSTKKKKKKKKGSQSMPALRGQP